MSTSVLRAQSRRVALSAALILTAVAAFSGPSAEAKPPARPGKVSKLAVGAVTKPATAYLLPASWNAGTGATSYRVKATDQTGSVLDSDTVTDTSWQATVVSTAGRTVRITVTPYNNNRRGQSSSVDKVMPDLTAPTGSFGLAQVGRNVTVTQTALSDDASPASNITRVVDWKDGTPAETWPSGGTQIGHTYPLTGLWHPTVTLTDAVGNSVVLPLGAAVTGDTAPPTGAFTAGPGSAWASYSTVALTQEAISDGDFSAAADIKRTVDWGDGSAAATWATGTAAEHVYTAAGSYTPKVELTDEAGNSATYDASVVTVTLDSVAPTVTLKAPRYARSVRSSRTLKGSATDAETGVAGVRVKAVEKRGTRWYGYRPATGTWVKAASKKAAWRQARAAAVTPTATGTWSSPLRHLAKGQLLVKSNGRDLVGNTSTWVLTSRKLTRS
ncbi:PKD domain-containing protein [Nocardioides ungokensis]|uniref:PKD domain-containing protein n=1 Tax=Nocardioides ungokensis TaxID=1643322 RepID=UPI0015DF6942|nr:hypothetical protein [Nocardioides ungokensis]